MKRSEITREHEENDRGVCWCNPEVVYDENGNIIQVIHNDRVLQ
jgi:hypothetical protein